MKRVYLMEKQRVVKFVFGLDKLNAHRDSHAAADAESCSSELHAVHDQKRKSIMAKFLFIIPQTDRLLLFHNNSRDLELPVLMLL